MSHRRRIIEIATLVALAAPVRAGTAQITTFIAPPNRARDSVKAAVAQAKEAVQDSVARAQITDMKTWVDSAAGLTVPPIPVDSSAFAPLPPVEVGSPAGRLNGARAPATAGSLPLLLLLGAGAMGAGALLLRPPALARRPVDADRTRGAS